MFPLAAVLAVSAVAVVNLLPAHSPATLAPSSAQAVVRGALQALATQSGTILHVRMVTEQEGKPWTRYQTETWSRQAGPSSPLEYREISRSPKGQRTETAVRGQEEQIYDASNNTIYESGPIVDDANPPYRVSPGSRPDTDILRTPAVKAIAEPVNHEGKLAAYSLVYWREPGIAQITITAEQARALRAERDLLTYRINGHRTPTLPPSASSRGMKVRPVVKPRHGSRIPNGSASEFRQQLQSLLRSGLAHAHLAGDARIAGRKALRISLDQGRSYYYVDPTSYAPIELHSNPAGADKPGGDTTRYTIYEALPDDASSTGLLSLRAQHPGARLDRNPRHFLAALWQS